MQADLLDNDDQLGKFPSLLRDDISLISCRGNRSRSLTPVSIDGNEDNQLRRNTEQQQSNTANTNQQPAILPRQGTSTHFLQRSTATQNELKLVLNDRQEQADLRHTGKSHQDQPLAVTERSFVNLFIQYPNALISNRTTNDSQNDTVCISYMPNAPPSSQQPAKTNHNDSDAEEDKLPKTLPPI